MPAPQGLSDGLRGKQKKIVADHQRRKLQGPSGMIERVQASASSSGQEQFFSWGLQEHNPLCPFLPTSTVCLSVPRSGVSPIRREAHRGKSWGHLIIREMGLVFVFSLEHLQSPLKPSYSTSAKIISEKDFWFWRITFLMSKKDFVKMSLTYSRCSSSLPDLEGAPFGRHCLFTDNYYWVF